MCVCGCVETLQCDYKYVDLVHRGRCAGMRSLKGAEVTSGQSTLTCGLAPGMHVHVLEFPLSRADEMPQTIPNSATVTPNELTPKLSCYTGK